MATHVAEFILQGAGLYTLLGAIFAVAFSIKGAGAIDPVAKHSPWSFRVMIIPASIALWPYLVVRWAKAKRVIP